LGLGFGFRFWAQSDGELLPAVAQSDGEF